MSLLLLLRGTPTPKYRLAEIPDALLGTKPVMVWDGGVIHQRVTTEGTPVIFDGTVLRQILSTETLQS